ncbi:MAG: hypothetical protein RLZZ150_496, partial [Bacteroidota bacterium]
VISDKDLSVLVRIHRTWVYVDVRVELLNRDGEATLTEQETDGRRSDALP